MGATEMRRLATRGGADPRREEGQLVTSLSVLVVVFALMVIAYIYFPVGAATSEKGQAQTAADAAALAGAGGVADQWIDGLSGRFDSLGELMDRVHLSGPACSATGESAARTYATDNGATVEAGSYCADWTTGEVVVTVRRSGSYAGGAAARAHARAELGFDPSTCEVEPGFPPPVPTPTPTPTPSGSQTTPPSPTPTPAPAPLPPAHGLIRCDSVNLGVTFEDGKFTLSSLGTVDDLLEPKLTG